VKRRKSASLRQDARGPGAQLGNKGRSLADRKHCAQAKVRLAFKSKGRVPQTARLYRASFTGAMQVSFEWVTARSRLSAHSSSAPQAVIKIRSAVIIKFRKEDLVTAKVLCGES